MDAVVDAASHVYRPQRTTRQGEAGAPLRQRDDRVEELLAEWLDAMADHDVRCVAVLGPSIAEGSGREVWSAFPGNFAAACEALARSDEYGPHWRERAAPSMAWQNFDRNRGGGHWSQPWLDRGVTSLVRADVSGPNGDGYELFAFISNRLAARSAAAEIGWSLCNLWPELRTRLLEQKVGLPAKTREILMLIAREGLTSAQAAARLAVSERTIQYHLQVAKQRLGVTAGSREPVILRAASLGLL